MKKSICRTLKGAVVASACLTAVQTAGASLVCWTDNGTRNWGNCTVSCETFFHYFGHLCNSSNQVACYNASSSSRGGTGVCEPCVTGFGPGVDGAGLVGEVDPSIYDGTPFIVVQRSGTLQMVVRIPSSGAVFVATLPPGPPVLLPSMITATRNGELPSYPPTEPFCSIPRPPVSGGDIVLTYAEVDANEQLVSFVQIPYSTSQLNFQLMPPPCPMDVNPDGAINTADLTGMLANYGDIVTPFTGGDTNGDGDVNTSDLVGLLARFGQTCP